MTISLHGLAAESYLSLPSSYPHHCRPRCTVRI